MTVEVTLRVNARDCSASVEARTSLGDLLRDELLLTGTHFGCEHGVCGACTLMLDGEPVRSCITLAAACQQAEVRTIEGFEDDPLMAALRRAFSRHHALQCGYCTPGMLVTAYDIVRRLPNADETRIRAELAGNLCRCTGYTGIVNAIAEVAGEGVAAQVQPIERAAVASAPMALLAPAVAADGPVRAWVAPDLADATTLTRQLRLPMSAEAAWTLLHSLETVAGCVPGATLDLVAGDEAEGRISAAIGPMRATFRGRARVSYDDDTRSGELTGGGDDSVSRSTVGGAMRFRVTASGPDACVVDADIRYRLKGPLAQVGRPAIVADVVDRLLGRFVANLAAAGAGRAVDATPLGGVRMMFGVLWAAVRRLFGLGGSEP